MEVPSESAINEFKAPVVEDTFLEIPSLVASVAADEIKPNLINEATSVLEQAPEVVVSEASVYQESIDQEPVYQEPAHQESVDESPDVVELEPIKKIGAADLLNNPLPITASEPMAGAISNLEQNIVPEQTFDFDWSQLTGLNWWQWVRNLPLAGMPMAIALNSALISRHENQLVMDVDPDQGALFNDAQRKRIEQVLCDVTGLSVQLLMHVQLPRGETPHQRRTRLMAERFAQAGHAIMEDEIVQSLVVEFEAHIIENSIRPIKSVS